MENVTGITFTASGNSLMFSWYDYVLFSLLLILNAVIGLYFASTGGKQATLWEYMWGKKELSAVPVALSLIISRISSVTLVALPADIYLYGTTFAWNFLWIPIIFVLNYYIYLPVILQLKTSSVYEYLELRYNNYLRRFASLTTAILLTCYIPIVMYLPALAFLQGLNINLKWIVPFISMVCVFYTLIGGIKAVIWTDTLQFVIVIGAISTILFLGIKSAGGFLRILEVSNNSGRFDWDFEWSLTKRDTFWAVVFGMSFEWISFICIDAPSIQKFLMLPNKREIKKVIAIFCIGEFAGKCFGVFSGLVVLTYYYGCDPITNGKIKYHDQLMPYYIMDLTTDLPGLSGFIIAGIYCAAASTMSTLLNGSATLIYEDLVSHYLPKRLKDTTVCYIVKAIVFTLGVITTLELFFIDNLGGILPLILTIFGTITGTMAGIFTMGMLVPRANSKGAMWGGLISFLFVSWLAWGRVWYKSKGYLKYDFMSLRTDECLNNITIPIKEKLDDNDIMFVYRITYYFYPLFGFVTVFLIGIPISWLTNNNDPPVDKKLISPIMHFILPKNLEPSTYQVMEEMRKLTKNEEAVVPDTIMF